MPWMRCKARGIAWSLSGLKPSICILAQRVWQLHLRPRMPIWRWILTSWRIPPRYDRLWRGLGLALARDNPGHWANAQGICVDLMVPPHVAGRGSQARAARLPPHDKMTARIGPGLALCLTDNGVRSITSLDPDDAREHRLRVANPPGLLVAKTIKAAERLQQAEGGRRSRIVDKDALDILRLLQTTSLDIFVDVLQSVPVDSPEEEDGQKGDGGTRGPCWPAGLQATCPCPASVR